MREEVNLDPLLAALDLGIKGTDRLRELVAYVNRAQEEIKETTTKYQDKLRKGLVIDAQSLMRKELGPMRARMEMAREILLNPQSFGEYLSNKVGLSGVELSWQKRLSVRSRPSFVQSLLGRRSTLVHPL